MFEVYEVEAWVLWLSWILFGVTAIGLAVFWKIAVVLNRSNGKANDTLRWAKESANALEKQYQYVIAQRDKAEANAREAEAGHREAVRKLREWEAIFSGHCLLKIVKDSGTGKAIGLDNIESLRDTAKRIVSEWEKLKPKRLKDGKFAPKSGKTGEKKKTSRK